jgi:hypothetical protein
MIEPTEPILDAPIPGMALTAELGGRPWQTPPQYATVEQALEYYIPRLTADEVSEQLLDVLEMGVPVTALANTMQLSGVMDGKHSVDVGILIMPVLMEMISYLADAAGVEYDMGTDKPKKVTNTLVDKAITMMEQEEEKENKLSEEETETVETTEEEIMIEEPKGLMARRTE